MDPIESIPDDDLVEESDSSTSSEMVEALGGNLNEGALLRLRKSIYSSNQSIDVGEDDELMLILDQVIQITDKEILQDHPDINELFRSDLMLCYKKIMVDYAFRCQNAATLDAIQLCSKRIVLLICLKLNQKSEDVFYFTELIFMIFNMHSKFNAMHSYYSNEDTKDTSGEIEYASCSDKKYPRQHLVELLNLFGRNAGFISIHKMFAADDNISVIDMHNVLRPLSVCHELLTANTIKMHIIPLMALTLRKVHSIEEKEFTRQPTLIDELSGLTDMLRSLVTFLRVSVPEFVEIQRPTSAVSPSPSYTSTTSSSATAAASSCSGSSIASSSSGPSTTGSRRHRRSVGLISMVDESPANVSDEEDLPRFIINPVIASLDNISNLLAVQKFMSIQRMLKISLFRSKMKALNELNKLIMIVCKTNLGNIKNEDDVIEREQLLQWLNDSHILEIMFKDCLHHNQYVDKAQRVVLFLVKFESLLLTDLDCIWKSQFGKHEAIVNNIYELIAKLSSKLNQDHIDYLFSLFRDSWKQYNSKQRENLLDLINRLGEEGQDNMVDKLLTLLWEFVEGGADDRVIDHALKTQITVLHRCDSREKMKQQLNWVGKFFNLVSEQKWSMYAMNQIIQIIDTSEVDNKFVFDSSHRETIVKRIFSRQNATLVFIDHFVIYMDKVRQIHKENPSLTKDDILLGDRYSHAEQLHNWLAFISYFIIEGHAFENCDGDEYYILSKIWVTLVQNYVFLQDQEFCFLWFTEQLVEDNKIKNPQLIPKFFKEFILTFDPKKLTCTGFTCVENFFKKVNLGKGKLAMIGDGKYILKNMNLLGLEYIWKVIMNADMEVSQAAILLMNDIFINLSPALQIDRVVVHDEIIHFCMNKLRSSYDTIATLIGSLPDDVFTAPLTSACPLAANQQPVELKRLSSHPLRPRTGSSCVEVGKNRGSSASSGGGSGAAAENGLRAGSKQTVGRCSSNLSSAEMMDMSSDEDLGGSASTRRGTESPRGVESPRNLEEEADCCGAGGEGCSMEVDEDVTTSITSTSAHNGINGHCSHRRLHQHRHTQPSPASSSTTTKQQREVKSGPLSAEPPLSPLANLNLDDLNALKLEIEQKTTSMSRMLNMVSSYVVKCSEQHKKGFLHLPMFRCSRGFDVSINICHESLLDVQILKVHSNEIMGVLVSQVRQLLKLNKRSRLIVKFNGNILNKIDYQKILAIYVMYESHDNVSCESLQTMEFIPIDSKLNIDGNLGEQDPCVYNKINDESIESEKLLPGVLLASSSDYLDFFLTLSSLSTVLFNYELQYASYSLLRCMPIVSSRIAMFNEISNIECKLNHDVLQKLIMGDNLTQCIYNLEVVYKLMMPIRGNTDEQIVFLCNFMKRGGLSVMCNMLKMRNYFCSQGINYMKEGYRILICICKMVFIIAAYNGMHSASKKNRNLDSEERKLAEYLEKALLKIPSNMYNFSIKEVACKIGSLVSEEDIGFTPQPQVLKCLQYLVLATVCNELNGNYEVLELHRLINNGKTGCLKYDHMLYQNSIELFTIYEMMCPLTKEDLERDITWTYFIEDLILTISNKNVRMVARNHFNVMCETSARQHPHLVSFILKQLISIPNALLAAKHTHTDQYFQLLCDCLKSVDINRDILNQDDLNKYINSEQQWLMQYQVDIRQGRSMPSILVQGHLNIFTRLVYLLDPHQKYILGSLVDHREWILIMVKDFLFPSSYECWRKRINSEYVNNLLMSRTPSPSISEPMCISLPSYATSTSHVNPDAITTAADDVTVDVTTATADTAPTIAVDTADATASTADSANDATGGLQRQEERIKQDKAAMSLASASSTSVATSSTLSAVNVVSPSPSSSSCPVVPLTQGLEHVGSPLMLTSVSSASTDALEVDAALTPISPCSSLSQQSQSSSCIAAADSLSSARGLLPDSSLHRRKSPILICSSATSSSGSDSCSSTSSSSSSEEDGDGGGGPNMILTRSPSRRLQRRQSRRSHAPNKLQRHQPQFTESPAIVHKYVQDSQTGEACFSLLVALCSRSIPNTAYLLDLLSNLFERNEKTEGKKWNHAPCIGPRASNGFVGLKNAGATCYMNSLLQQIFMIEPIREYILSIPGDLEDFQDIFNEDSDDEVFIPQKSRAFSHSASSQNAMTESTTSLSSQPNSVRLAYNDCILRHIQAMFAHLQSSEKQYYTPRQFWKHFRLLGMQINPHEQHDSLEFYNSLVDSIDEALKALNNSVIMNKVMGGTFCDQKKCLDCPHSYFREEKFTCLNIEISNKANLQESLEQYVKCDLLDGANAYHCEKCNKKVDTMKGMSVKRLPKVLAIQLKRFGYDWENNSAAKFNDYFEFPRTLDMMPYTALGLAKAKGEKLSEEIDEPLLHEQCTDYRLRGIVIHSGQAYGGHYYSYIRHKNSKGEYQWYRFDDSDVTEIELDDEEMKQLCFGGYIEENKKEGSEDETNKWYSAYILFYESTNNDTAADIENSEQDLKLETPRKSLGPQCVQDLVNKGNMSFHHKSNQFIPEYFNFIRDLMRENMYSPQNDKMSCIQESEEMCKISSRFLFKNLFEIIISTKFIIRGDLDDWLALCIQHLKYFESSRAIFANLAFMGDDNNNLEKFFFRCSDSDIRESMLSLLINYLICAVDDNPVFVEDPLILKSPFSNIDIDYFNLTHSEHFMVKLLNNLTVPNDYIQGSCYISDVLCLIQKYMQIGPSSIAVLQEFRMCYILVRMLRNNFLPNRYDFGSNDTCTIHRMISTLMINYDLSPVSPNTALANPYKAHTNMPSITKGLANQMYTGDWYLKKLISNAAHLINSAVPLYLSWQNAKYSRMTIDSLLDGLERAYTYEMPDFFASFKRILLIKDRLHPDRIIWSLENGDNENGLLTIIRTIERGQEKRAYNCIKMISECSEESEKLYEALYNENGRYFNEWNNAFSGFQDFIDSKIDADIMLSSNSDTNGYSIQRTSSVNNLLDIIQANISLHTRDTPEP